MKPPVIYDIEQKRFLKVWEISWDENGNIKRMVEGTKSYLIGGSIGLAPSRFIINPTCGKDCDLKDTCYSHPDFNPNDPVCGNFKHQENTETHIEKSCRNCAKWGTTKTLSIPYGVLRGEYEIEACGMNTWASCTKGGKYTFWKQKEETK